MMQWRSVGRVAAAVLFGLLVAAVVAAVGIAGATGEIYTARGPGAPPAPVDTVAVPVHEPAKPTAVIVLNSQGANAADVLAPTRCWPAPGRSISTPSPPSAGQCP
jgi:hypothetical protein